MHCNIPLTVQIPCHCKRVKLLRFKVDCAYFPERILVVGYICIVQTSEKRCKFAALSQQILREVVSRQPSCRTMTTSADLDRKTPHLAKRQFCGLQISVEIAQKNPRAPEFKAHKKNLEPNRKKNYPIAKNVKKKNVISRVVLGDLAAQSNGLRAGEKAVPRGGPNFTLSGQETN